MKHFPEPQPDETLYSVAARHLLLMPEKPGPRMTTDLFGIPHIKLNCASPTKLASFYDRVGQHFWASTEEMLAEHTIMGALSRWIPEAAYRPLVDKALASHMAWRLTRAATQARSSRFCEACRDDDVERAGFAYWRVHHQLPLVVACPKHALLLLDRCPRCLQQAASNTQWNLPPHSCRCGFAYASYAPANDDQVRVARFIASLQLESVDVCTPASRGMAYRHQANQLRQTTGELVDNRALRRFATSVLGAEQCALLRFPARRLLGQFGKQPGPAASRFNEVELLLAAKLFEHSEQLREAMTRVCSTPATPEGGQRWSFETLLAQIELRRGDGAVNATSVAHDLGVSTKVVQYACLRGGLRLCRNIFGYAGIAAEVIPLASEGLRRHDINARLPGLSQHVHAIRIVYSDVIEDAWTEHAKRLISSLCATGKCRTRLDLENHSTIVNRALRTVHERDPAWLDRVVPRVAPFRGKPPNEEVAAYTSDWERVAIDRIRATYSAATASGNTRPKLAFLSWLAFGEQSRLSALRGRSDKIRRFTDALLASAQS